MAESAALDQLLQGQLTTLVYYPDGRQVADCRLSGAVLSGSFNPLHAGHTKLLAAATQTTGLPALFELPVVNADKGVLARAEVERRLVQFRDRYLVVLSRAPLFSQKAALFPRSVFVVGFDTAIRLIAPRYYGGAAAMRAAFDAIRAAQCRFLVAGRLHNGRFQTLADLDVPADLADLLQALPEDAFRQDISSTELRNRGGDQPTDPDRAAGRGL